MQDRVMVIVVDDFPGVPESIAAMLSEFGYTTVTAPDGQSALELAQRVQPQVALIDIDLPDMIGYALARLLREAHGDGMTLIGMSGGFTGKEVAGSNLDHFLTKPIVLGRLLALLPPTAQPAAGG